MVEGSPLPVPTLEQLGRIAPTSLVVLTIVGIGFYIGWRVRGEVIQVLREWLEHLKRGD